MSADLKQVERRTIPPLSEDKFLCPPETVVEYISFVENGKIKQEVVVYFNASTEPLIIRITDNNWNMVDHG